MSQEEEFNEYKTSFWFCLRWK